MRGYSDRVNGKGKEDSRRTYHGDVTSYSGTRAACNERLRNCSSAVYVESLSSTIQINVELIQQNLQQGIRLSAVLDVDRGKDCSFCLYPRGFRGKQNFLSPQYNLRTVDSALRRQTRLSQTKFTVVPLDVIFEADTKDRIIPSDVRSTGSSSGCIIVIDSSGSRTKKTAGAVGRQAREE
ncbi:hypothetical protein ALC56_09880 [Trachymyrmex septentrionalis]|uniref:Uncharacterized protein n=1 Tax=Trachymyrmex septentrionalis TaxID=34720 RepID=A0A151JU64_9HYME|nr:hypothetical protein ALC56_09880 [Trachymyrmex septentrionalis]